MLDDGVVRIAPCIEVGKLQKDNSSRTLAADLGRWRRSAFALPSIQPARLHGGFDHAAAPCLFADPDYFLGPNNFVENECRTCERTFY